MSESMGTAVLTLRADDSQLNSDLSKAGSAITAWAARINASLATLNPASVGGAFKSLTTTIQGADGVMSTLKIQSAELAAQQLKLSEAAAQAKVRIAEEVAAVKNAAFTEAAQQRTTLANAIQLVKARLLEEAQAAKQAAQEEKAAQSASLAQEKLNLARAVAETKMRLMEEAQAAHSAAGGFNALHAAMQPVSGGFTILKGAIASTLGNLASTAIRDVTSGLFDLGRGIVGMGISAIKANGDLEQTQVAFKVLTGSAAEANAEIKVLQQYADHTSFTFVGVKQAAIDLQTAGFSAKQAEAEMTRLGDAVAGMGGGDQQLQEIAVDVAQVAVKGHLAGQEVLQFANAGIPMVQILADKFHTTKDNIDKMISGGLIPANVAIQTLNDYIGTKFANAADQQSHTFNGMISTLQDWFNRALQIVGQPLFEKLKPKLEEFLNFLSQPSTLAALAKFGEDLGTVIGNAIDWITNTAIPTLVQAWPQITAIIGDVASIIGSAASTFATIASYAVSWGAGIIDALAQGIYAGAEAVIEAVNFIASIITSLLETHSPPKVLPKLPDWGKGAIQSWIDGWKQGDFSVFDGIADTVKSYLTGLSDLGRFGKSGIVPAVFGTEEAMTTLLTQLKETGTVSQASLDAVTQAAGPAGDMIRGLVEAEVSAAQASRDLESAHADVAAATQRVSDAQDNLNAVTEDYANKLQPVNDALAKVSQQERDITQARDERQLAKDVSPERVALAQRIATLELQKAQQDMVKTQADTTLKTAQLMDIVNKKGADSTEGKKALADIASLQTEVALKQAQDQQHINDLQDKAGDTSKTQLDTLKLQKDQLTDQKTTIEDQKTAAEKLAQAQLDAVTKEETAAKKRETQAQAVVDAANKQVTAQKNIVTEMEKQNALLHEQEQTIASLAGGGAGGAGGGKGGGKGGGVGGALGAAVANAGKGGLLGNLETQLAAAGKNIDDAKTKLGNLFNMSGITDFKDKIDGIATGFKNFASGLDSFAKSATPVIADLTQLIKLSLDPNAKSTGSGLLDTILGKDGTKTPSSGAAGADIRKFIDDYLSKPFWQRQVNQNYADQRSMPAPNTDGYNDFISGKDDRKYAARVDPSGAYIPPNAAQLVTSQEDAIAHQKKIYQSVADWAKGPEAQALSREGWNTLLRIAPDIASGALTEAKGFAKTLLSPFTDNTLKGKLGANSQIVDEWGKTLVDLNTTTHTGMATVYTTYGAGTTGLVTDTKTKRNTVREEWSKGFDDVESAMSGSQNRQLQKTQDYLNSLNAQNTSSEATIYTAYSNHAKDMEAANKTAYSTLGDDVRHGMSDIETAQLNSEATQYTNYSSNLGNMETRTHTSMATIYTNYSGALDDLKNITDSKLPESVASWKRYFDSIAPMTKTSEDTVYTQYSANLQDLQTASDAKLTKIGKTWEDNFAGLAPTVTAQQKPVSDAAKGIADGALAALNAVDTSVPGANLVLGYIRGINSQAGAASAAARQLANTTNQAFQGAQKISSPSKVWEEFGHYTIDGLILGIANKIPNAVAMISTITGRMTLAAHKGADDIGGALDAIPAKLADFGKAIHESDPAYKGWFGGIGINDPKSVLFGGQNHGDLSGIDATAPVAGAAPSDGALASVASTLTDWASTTTSAMTSAGQGIGQALLAGIAAGVQMGQDALRKALAGVTALLRDSGSVNAGHNVGNMNSLLPDFGNASRQMVGNMMNTPYPLNLPEYHMNGGQTATKAGNTYNMHTTINNPQQPMAELQRDFQRWQFMREGGD